MFQVLKGHDDHVITCLQFCGNRIVSGSDDNTLKVWSAVTGKVSLVIPVYFLASQKNRMNSIKTSIVPDDLKESNF